MLTLGIGIGVVVLAALGLSGKGRYMLKGFYNLFFYDAAKTVKGAEAIYTQAIEEAQHQYNLASTNLQKIGGMLDTAERNLRETNEKIVDTKRAMESFAKQKDFNKVDLYAIELTSLEEDLAIYSAEVTKYTPMKKEAEALTAHYERELVTRKKDKKTVVRQIEMNQQTKEMYDDLDQLKNTKASSKMLEAVKEGLMESTETAAGARILHESKHSTKMLNAQSELKSLKQSEYVEELKKKYQK